MKKNQKILILISIILLSGLFLYFKLMSNVNSQSETPTTANVSVSGCLDSTKGVMVTYFPVNFTAGSGRTPGRNVSKANGPAYIIINMSLNTNIPWNVHMNASNFIPIDGIGAPISPKNITVWTDCDGGTAITTNLDYDYSLKYLCQNIGYNRNISVYFNLSIPVGQYNNTYVGNLTIYVNSSQASSSECNNRTWNGPGNTTVNITKNREFGWNPNTVNIDFQTLSPGTGFGVIPSANATFNKGFPANITIQENTNILTDVWIKGTDLIGLTGQAAGAYNISIGLSGNLTYSNATSNTTWPAFIKFLNYSYQSGPGPIYQADFWNWYRVKNKTDVSSFWNISIPGGVNGAKQGTYGGDVIATVIETGTQP